MRESSSETLGISPYMCVFGRLPRGLLAVLRDNWLGMKDLPTNFGKLVNQYLKELTLNLESAEKFVAEHAKKAQNTYARNYNRRAKDKHFNVDDRVIVLMPDNTHSRLYSRWIGPATIVEVKSPYSYLVDMPDGSRNKKQYVINSSTKTATTIL